MPSSEFLDYEPIRRPKKSREAEEDDFSKVAPRRRERGLSEGQVRSFDTNEWAWETAPASESISAAPAIEQTTLARGHGLSFAGLFLFTFLVYFRPYELSPSLLWLSTSAFWAAALTLAVYIPTQLGLEGRITIRTREVNALLLLTLFGILSVPLASDPSRAWGAWLDYLKVVVMFVVMVNVVRTPRRLDLLIILVFAVSVVLSASAINDYSLGRLGVKGDRIEGALGGLFSNPNDLALHLVTIIPLGVAMLRGTRNLLKKILLFAVCLTMVGGLVATFSRGGFIGFVAITLVLSWKFARRYRAAVLALGAIAIGVVLALAPAAYFGRISTSGDDSAVARLDDLKRSTFIAIRHPLLGIGMDNYELYSNREKTAHNAYTQVAGEMGLIALSAYLIFLLSALKSLRKIESSAAPRSKFYYLSVGLQASLIGYMVNSFFLSVAYLWYAYYLVGYSVCLSRLAAAEQRTAAPAPTHET
jgi:probable O-glycosylation ligase (exosortase A-associated)